MSTSHQPTAVDPDDDPAVLHARMVDRLLVDTTAAGPPPTDRVIAALRAVPRHLFAPAVPLATAYSDDTLVTGRDANGVASSWLPAPTMVALMLHQLHVRPGHAVLKLGSGAYMAALLDLLVGPTGMVVSIANDPDAIERAHHSLAAHGHTDVTLLCTHPDGAPDYAPFDRIIAATAHARDLPHAWATQLVTDGHLVRLRYTDDEPAHLATYQPIGGRLVRCNDVAYGNNAVAQIDHTTGLTADPYGHQQPTPAQPAFISTTAAEQPAAATTNHSADV